VIPLRQELKELDEEVARSIPAGERRSELSKLQKQADSKLAAVAYSAEVARSVAVAMLKRGGSRGRTPNMAGPAEAGPPPRKATSRGTMPVSTTSTRSCGSVNGLAHRASDSNRPSQG
jgi:hypothetical protein